MKIFKTLPTVQEFFNRYANLVYSLTRIAWIAQFITGVCELGILYALFYPTLNDLFPNIANGASMGLSLFCASLLQIGLKKVFPYSVRAVLFKRFKGLDLAFTVFIIILTVALLVCSVFLSYKGSHDIGALAVPIPKEKTTTTTDSAKAATERQANTIFSTDSNTIEIKYLGKGEAIKSEYESRINTAVATASKSRAKSPLYAKEYDQRAQNLRNELKTKLAILQSEKATEIEAKATERKATISRATDRNDKEAGQILTDNQTAKETALNKQKQYGGYIGYFTLFCYVFFLTVFTLNEIHAKGSGIDATPEVSQRYFAPSLFSVFAETLKAKIDYFFRSRLQKWSDKTPAFPLPENVQVLYNYDANFFHNVQQIEAEKIDVKPLKIAAKGQRIGTIKEGEATKETGRKIGFFSKNTEDDKESKETQNIDSTKIVGGTKKTDLEQSTFTVLGGTNIVGSCPNCLNSFVKNHKKHVYCSDQCRIEFNEKAKGYKVHKNKTGKN